MDISTIRSILNGDAVPNTGQYRVAMGKLYDFLTAFTGTDSADTTTLATLLGVTLAQRTGVVGSMRNARMRIAAASNVGNFIADEVIVQSALGGERRCLKGVNGNVNLGAVGAGGMDVAPAPTSGFVCVYLGYSPTAGNARLFAQDATAAALGEVYGGANLPAGYTMTALVGVWPTDSSGRFKIGQQIDREIFLPNTLAFQSAGQKLTPTSFSVAAVVPKNAKSMRGSVGGVCPTSQALNFIVAGDASNTGWAYASASPVTAVSAPFERVPLITPQTLYCTANSSADTPTVSIYCTGYSF
ncbi:phage tail protein [Herbaspirillum frisingense]|uniref:phage tail protein n=1 Tax=Herbaspirillum frisingense TaxID=92645 RepID=UPI0039AFDD50